MLKKPRQHTRPPALRFPKTAWEKTLAVFAARSQHDAGLLKPAADHEYYSVIKNAISQARFRANHQAAAEVIINAIQISEDFRSRPRIPYRGMRPTWQAMGTKRSAGRPSDELRRLYLLSAVTRAWILGFGSLPTINNRKAEYEKKFVFFAESISECLEIQRYHLIDYLGTYRAYKKALSSGLTYEEWCKKRAQAREERRAALEKNKQEPVN